MRRKETPNPIKKRGNQRKMGFVIPNEVRNPYPNNYELRILNYKCEECLSIQGLNIGRKR